jgi:hypothetical protein
MALAQGRRLLDRPPARTMTAVRWRYSGKEHDARASVATRLPQRTTPTPNPSPAGCGLARFRQFKSDQPRQAGVGWGGEHTECAAAIWR